MNRIVSDSLIAQARDRNSLLTREERAQIFTDRSLEERAMNARYKDGTRIKEAIDKMIARGGVPSCHRSDSLGRQYVKMIERYRALSARKETAPTDCA